MPADHNPRIKTRLRKGRQANARPPVGTLMARMQQHSAHRMATGKRGWRGAYVPRPGRWAQHVVVKATVFRQQMSGYRSWTAALKQHLGYVQREGVERGGASGQMYNRDGTGIETTGFLGRSAGDRHQFRFIISAERGEDLDLTHFTRSLMQQVEDDLGTRLDWVAVNHYDTDHPHTHVLLRGVDEHGKALMIQPHYIAEGLRYRAQDVATLELGPRVERQRVRAHTRDLDIDV